MTVIHARPKAPKKKPSGTCGRCVHWKRGDMIDCGDCMEYAHRRRTEAGAGLPARPARATMIGDTCDKFEPKGRA